MSNIDTKTIIDNLIKYFRENDLRIHGELANDTNIYVGSLKSNDAKQRATLVFIGEYVVLVLIDIGNGFPYVGNVYVSGKPIVHNVANYLRIAFKKSKTTHTLDFPVDVETCGQRVIETVTKLTAHTVQEIMDHCMNDAMCNKAVQNLIRVGFITPDHVIKVIDGHLRQAMKMLPYRDFVYTATQGMTTVAISRKKNMDTDLTQVKFITIKAGAK